MKALALSALLLSTAFVPLAAHAEPAPTEQKVIADGHVDLGPRFVDGRWTVQLRDDTVDPAVWRPLDTVVLQASAKAQVTVPADPAYSFLGTAGKKVWVIPQVQQAGIPWPGWNTQDTEVAQRVDREVTWSLQGVKGPGTFTLFLNSDFGKPAPVFDSRKPLPQQTGVDVGTHVHGNWTFDAEGTYLLDVAMSARLTDGTTVSDHGTLRLYAGSGDARSAFAVEPTTSETPASTPATSSQSTGVPPWAIAGGAAVLLVGAVLVVLRRMRKVRG
ncbi:choice-of-anchor M domain-containing protein [Kribbella sp. CA-253562]|uniref:choice-of-anchor M domain-containing protein n=1 Tax=Kribbella sp. CA-253562 TaxID=3239942 RepID=UPI003D90DEF6